MKMRFKEEYYIKTNGVLHIIAEIEDLYIQNELVQEDGFIDLSKGNVAAINGLDAYAVAKGNTRLEYQRPKKIFQMD